ncbi:MAG: hypothetical protein K1X75_10390 [Leptospirales bacterium]|nr:hypothetical protein [Leptospirales bacterium]
MLTLTSAPVFAEDLPDVNVDVGLNFVSNYIFRGADLHQGRAQQKGESYGANTGEWAFQPTITFNGPSGLFFNIWGSFATAGRKDTDTDLRFQSAPGGAVATTTGNVDAPSIVAAYQSVTLAQALSQDRRVGAVPGFYKEANGLERADEIDLTLGYNTSTKEGNFGFGLVHYTGPNPDTKTAFPQTTEVFFTYALPFLTELTFSYYTDTEAFNDANYYNLAYGSSVSMTDDLSLSYKVAAGYGAQNRLQGWQDVTGTIGVSFSGFTVGFNYVYRPDIRFFDTDNATGNNDGSAAWLNGTSTRGDGLVADPARNNGPINSYINSAIQAQLTQLTGGGYTYTPRQKLPTGLWFVNVGYSFSI